MIHLSNSLYDKLKFLVLIFLPLFGTLYFIVSGFTAIPFPNTTVGVVIALDTVLGIGLYLSSAEYHKDQATGTLVVKEIGDKKIFSLELDGDPEYDLEGKEEVIFKIKKEESG